MPDHYGTIEGADAYHAARANTAWAVASEADKTAALVRGSQYLDAIYGARYPGRVSDASQALEWPRERVVWRGQAVDVDEVPEPIKNAAYEAALRELALPGSLIPDFDPAAAVKREKVGSLEVEYADAAQVGGRPVIGVIDGIMLAFLAGTVGSLGASNFRITRA